MGAATDMDTDTDMAKRRVNQKKTNLNQIHI